MEASTLIDVRVIDAATTVVPVVAHGPLEHGTFETMENGRAVTRCKLYRNLDCTEHEATHEALKPYQGTGRFRIPFTVWIDPEGNKLFRRDGWRRPEEFLLDIKLAIEKVPGPHRSKSDYTALVKPLDEARAALAAQRYGEAAAKFEEAGRPDVPEVRKLAEEGLREVQTYGDSVLAAAKAALKGGRTRQARPALDMLARQFQGLECGREALGLIRGLAPPLRSLSLSDMGPAGGRKVFVRGDGTGVVQIVAPRKEGAIGLHERRFEFSLDARSWTELSKLLESRRFFDIKIPDRAGAADESKATISLELWTGESATVSKWAGEKTGDFDAYGAWVLALADAASGGRASMEGAYDPEWRPEGFTR